MRDIGYGEGNIWGGWGGVRSLGMGCERTEKERREIHVGGISGTIRKPGIGESIGKIMGVTPSNRNTEAEMVTSCSQAGLPMKGGS